MVALVVTATAQIAFTPAAFAQSGATSAVVPQVPQVVVDNRDMVPTVAQWPAVDVRVDRDAYVTMFAVTRGGSDLPIHVLSPGNPGDNGRLRAGRSYQPRSLSAMELMHLTDFGEAPLIIAFASNVKPDLTALADGRRWSNALFVADSAAPDTRELVNALAKEIYGLNVPFSVSVSPVSQPLPASVVASNTLGQAGGLRAQQCLNDAVTAQRELLSVGVQTGGIGAAFLAGVPYVIAGAQRVVLQYNQNPTGSGCGEYRIAYLPRTEQPSRGQVRTVRNTVDSTYVERPSTRGGLDRSVSGDAVAAPEARKAPKTQPDAQGAAAPFEPSRRKSEPKTDTKVETKSELRTEPAKTPPEGR